MYKKVVAPVDFTRDGRELSIFLPEPIFDGEAFTVDSDVYIPMPDCRAYETYNDFVNHALGELLVVASFATPIRPHESVQRLDPFR